jgi:hypothetical protein
MRSIAFAVIASLALAASAQASTTSVPSTSDDPAWLEAHGLTPVSTLEVQDDPAKLPQRCWHARVFAGLRAYNNGKHKFAVWAWNEGIVCSLNGQIDEFHQRHGKGSNDPWSDGPYPSIATHQLSGDRRMAYSHYQTDWKMGYANWGAFLNLRQYFSKRVDRTVRWHHYGSS